MSGTFLFISSDVSPGHAVVVFFACKMLVFRLSPLDVDATNRAVNHVTQPKVLSHISATCRGKRDHRLRRRSQDEPGILA